MPPLRPTLSPHTTHAPLLLPRVVAPVLPPAHLTNKRRQVFKALQSAYVALLQNPFFNPDEHTPPEGRGGRKITSRRFGAEVRRIGEAWYPGVSAL